MVRFDRRFDKKSAGILNNFEDFLGSFISEMAVLYAVSADRKPLPGYLVKRD
jgi:hypothetical protein